MAPSVLRFLALLLAALFWGGGSQAQSAEGASLYDRLGGQAGVQRLSEELIDLSSTDARTKRSFDKVDLKRLKRLLAEQLCALTGGGCVYSGDDMKTSHAGLNITEEEFYRMVEHLREVLDRNGVGTREKNELLARLAPTKRDIVIRTEATPEGAAQQHAPQ